MNRRSLLLAAGATALSGCATTTPSASSAPMAEQLDSAIAAAMPRVLGAPGLAVAVYTRDGVYARGFGVTDISTGARADADTAFYIASSTKPLTALALATLEGRGEIDLGTTLAAYAPDAPFPAAVRANEVTIRNMLAHTSGISNEPIGHRVAFSGQHDPETLWRLLGVSQVNTDAPLGTFEYANIGYNITTVLTDRRTGVRWQDLLQREVFGPTGMTRTTAIRSQADAGGWSLAKPHWVTAEGQTARVYLEKVDQTMQSAGGVFMSANDAARWLELMVEDGRVGGRQVIPAAVVQGTRTPLATVDDEFEGYRRERYGLGWHIGPHRGETLYHHFGGFAGARAHVSYMPSRGIGVAVFVNDSSLGAPLADLIANYAYDLQAGRSDAQATFDSALGAAVQRGEQGLPRMRQDLANRAQRPWLLSRPHPAYVGVYDSDEFGPLEITSEADGLHVRKGVLHAIATPFTRPDSIRVELVPGLGTWLQFEGTGERPTGCRSPDAAFVRRA